MKRILRLILAIIVLANVCNAQDLKIMTYNIRFDNPNDGVNAWPNRKSRVFDLIKKYDPDFIGIQEALKHQIDEILEALPEYTYLGVGRDDGKSAGEYSAIIFKKQFNVLDQNTFWLSETRGVPGSKSWDAAITRVVTWGKFTDKKSGKEFVVVNTHFDHIGQEARSNSATIIKETLDNIALPAIVTGDFNCERTETPFKVITEQKGRTLIDPAPANPRATFCNFGLNSQECIAIDYIFHTKEWKASDYQVIADNDGKNYPSDHLPVMVRLKLKSK